MVMITNTKGDGKKGKEKSRLPYILTLFWLVLQAFGVYTTGHHALKSVQYL